MCQGRCRCGLALALQGGRWLLLRRPQQPCMLLLSIAPLVPPAAPAVGGAAAFGPFGEAAILLGMPFFVGLVVDRVGGRSRLHGCSNLVRVQPSLGHSAELVVQTTESEREREILAPNPWDGRKLVAVLASRGPAHPGYPSRGTHWVSRRGSAPRDLESACVCLYSQPAPQPPSFLLNQKAVNRTVTVNRVRTEHHRDLGTARGSTARGSS